MPRSGRSHSSKRNANSKAKRPEVSEAETSVLDSTDRDTRSEGSSESDISPPAPPPRSRTTRSKSHTKEHEKTHRKLKYESPPPSRSSKSSKSKERGMGRDTHSSRSKSRTREEAGFLLLRIYKIRGLQDVRHKRKACTIEAKFQDVRGKSKQIEWPKGKESLDLQEDCFFSWPITAKAVQKLKQDKLSIEVVCRAEVVEEEGKNKWTHVFGTVDLAWENRSKEMSCVELDGTESEPGHQKIYYKMEMIEANFN